jgi:hypothetical protein
MDPLKVGAVSATGPDESNLLLSNAATRRIQATPEGHVIGEKIPNSDGLPAGETGVF